MKANELMIGDWILYGEKPVQVLQLTSEKIYRGFYPILLTEEILKKNGFKPQGTGWILEDSTGERIFNLCRISNAYCLLTAGMTLAFQYVHELQHLFRLAGMKREIKL